jgi:AcrR family transcriptional regulator
MAHDAHIRAKAIELRTKYNMTLDDIVERLQISKTTVYYWIKDIPIPRTEKQTERQKIGTRSMQAKYTAKREQAYQQGLAELPELLKEPTFRDFVVLYMAEGTKRHRNEVSFVNSDEKLVKLAHHWICRLTTNSHIDYRLQYHADHDVEELKQYWGEILGIPASKIVPMRKSNSNQLSGRQFRSVHGLLTVRVGDTYFRSRLQAWMDFIKNQW